MKTLSTLPVTALLVVVVGIMFVARPASAVMVESGTTTLFSDNFENDTVGLAPSNPQVGTWTSTASGYTVINAVSPGPAQGTRYLRAVRPNGGVAIADFGAVNSGTVTASFNVFLPVGAPDALMQVSLGPVADAGFAGIASAPVWLSNGGSSNTVHTYIAPGGDASEFDTGVPITLGTWQTWRINYTFNNTVNPTNDDTFTITVGANTSAPIFAGGYGNVADPSNIRYLSYRVGDNGTFYLDGFLPEPTAATTLILCASVAGLVRRRAR